ncbi:hypothetical protein P3W45_000449 [Vairimorpha bombi]|jgi:hypothetical protein
MNHWSFDSNDLPRYSLTEMLVPPSCQIHKKLIDLQDQFDKSYYLDTVGNLMLYNTHNSLDIYVIYISSIRKLVRELHKFKTESNFLLVIDSISFLADKNVQIYLQVYSIFWNLITKNKCTVICTNHYRKAAKNLFVPRLGGTWSRIVTNRIFYKFLSNKLVYEIINNDELRNTNETDI